MQLISPSQCFAIAMLLSGFLPPCAFSQEAKPPKATGNEGELQVPAFKAPDGWRRVDVSPLTLARFEIGPEDRRVIVTVTGLRGDGGGLVANINRWRSQLDLRPLTDDDARKSARSVHVDGIDATAVDIEGLPMDGKPAQRILAVIVKHGGSTWFFRLSGPADLVVQERANFTRFLESVRFRSQAATLPSPVRIDSGLSLHPDNPHYFLFRGKPTVLITSAEHYGAVLNLDFDYKKYLDELHANRLNLTRTFTGVYAEDAKAFGITRNTLAPTEGKLICPWARSDAPGYAGGGNKFDLTKWDPAYFARLKDFVAQAGKRGVVVELNLFCPFYEDSMWRLSPMNSANNVNDVGKLARESVYNRKKNGGLQAVQENLVRKLVTELNAFDNLYSWEMIEKLSADPKLILEARLPGTGRDGGPSCATVRPAKGWTCRKR
jgi:hypothetical protein